MYLKAERGFSLTELMVTVGILGGIALVTMRLFEDQTNKEALIRSKSEIQKTISLVKQSLSKPVNCRLNLNPYTIPQIQATGTTGHPHPNLKTYVSSTSTKLLLGSGMNYNHFKTDNILLFSVPGEPSKVRLQLKFLHKKKSSDGAVSGNWTSVSESLFYTVSKNSLGQITDCGEVVCAANATAKQKFCKSLGSAAIWNASTGKCTFAQMTCPFGEVVMKLNTFGGVQCGPIKDYIKLDTLFDVSTCTNTSGKYRIVSNGAGKLKVECVP
jgi:prepilin-type N-terminal cleavage/methylation domain-containing protein